MVAWNMTHQIDPWQREIILFHSQRLVQSFNHWTGQPLISVAGSPGEIAQALFEAPFVVLSHGLEADPILNYGNQMALTLWQMDWAQFTQMPSRLTAEPIERVERDRLLTTAATQGYISNYTGVRISQTGQRFLIENAIIWNIVDDANQHYGQAAMFNHWQPITR